MAKTTGNVGVLSNKSTAYKQASGSGYALCKAASGFFPEYGSVNVFAGVLRARAFVVADGVNKRRDRSYRQTDLDESE